MRTAAAVVVLALTILLGVMVLAATGPVGPAAATGEPIAAEPPELENISDPVLVYDIDLDRDGNASWAIRAKFPTATESDATAFTATASEYEADGDERLPMHPFELAASAASSELDRDMELHTIEREVHTGDRIGILELTFEWSSFAATDDYRVYYGDVFAATEGGWMGALDEREYVRVHPPENYTIEESSAPVHDRTMWFAGPRDLTPAELSATFVSPDAYVEPPDPPDENDAPLLPGELFVALGALAILVAVTIVAVDRRPSNMVGRMQSALSIGFGVPVVRPRNGNGNGQESAEERPHPMDDPSLLSDEERVLRLVELNGGRMKQRRIVEETDWSNAKVSQLLSGLADEGRIEKLRMGRENLISLPDGDDD